MRIVALAPGATEIVCAIGLADELVGIADDPSPQDLAALAEAPFVAAARVRPGGGRDLRLDDDALRAAAPDLILAPAGLALPAGIGEASVLTIDPASLEGLFNAIATIGSMTAAEDEALELVEELRDRLGSIEERVRERSEAGHRPVRVVALEGLDPLHGCGRWVPEQIRRAGGWEVLGREGAEAPAITWAAIADVDPEALVLMPTGLDLPATVAAWEGQPRPDGWDDLAAVHLHRVIAVDGRGYFGVPGPRLIDGIALLAEVLDPAGFEGIAPEAAWTPLD